MAMPGGEAVRNGRMTFVRVCVCVCVFVPVFILWRMEATFSEDMYRADIPGGLRCRHTTREKSGVEMVSDTYRGGGVIYTWPSTG
ncbi:hypothetical protein LY76DRAFT_197166 [Colletotrichum caudatum]|nr:hypothetical protein LY76DRAFT_197166 [Colletotrichum caudatum]